MEWVRSRSWYSGAATLVITAWCAAVWLIDSFPRQISPSILAGAFVVALVGAYLLARPRGRTAAAFLVLVLLGMAGLWMLSPAAGVVGAVLVLVVGLESVRPPLKSASSGRAALLVVAELAALATIAMLTISLVGVPVRVWWAGATWLTFGMALLATAASDGSRGPSGIPGWRFLALAGLLICVQVGIQAYGTWRPLPPGPPTWVEPVSTLMILLALLALSVVQLRGGHAAQSHITSAGS